MIMSRNQNAARIHNIKTDSSFERVEQFKYLAKPKESKFYSGRNEAQIEVKEYLLSLGGECFVF